MSRIVSITALAIIGVTALPGAAGAATKPAPADLTVMSRNLYLGADLLPLAAATTPAAFEETAAKIWNNVQKTDFPTRAKALAKEIQEYKPDLIGLQEAAVWRKSADGVKEGGANDTTFVVYDYIATLRSELRKLGLNYRVAVTQDEFDFVGPTSLGYLIRLTQRDAILVRQGSSVRVSGPSRKQYKDALVIPTQAGQARSVRGWVAVNGTLRGKRFRFANTHLEAYGDTFRVSQAKELVGPTGPVASRKLTSILVGDLNADPTDAAAQAASYTAVTGAGFVNVFPKLIPTSGEDELLDNATTKAARSIDHILTRPKLRVTKRAVFGNKPGDRINNLWPSDHAGTVATVRLP